MRELTFVFPLFVGLLFLLGKGFIFGLEGAEPILIPIPQNVFVGWLFISLAILWVFPPWMVARITRTIKNIIRYIRQEKGLLKQQHEDTPRY